jgi:hypothetical protein
VGFAPAAPGDLAVHVGHDKTAASDEQPPNAKRRAIFVEANSRHLLRQANARSGGRISLGDALLPVSKPLV